MKNIKKRWGATLALCMLGVVAVVGAACGGGGVAQSDFDALQDRVTSIEQDARELSTNVTALQNLATSLSGLIPDGGVITPPPTATPDPADTARFSSDQLRPVEEAAVVRDVLGEISNVAVTFDPLEGGPLVTQVVAQQTAGRGDINVVGSTYGGLLGISNEASNAFQDVSGLLSRLEADRDFSEALVEEGQVDGVQVFIPWLQAVYTMAAHRDALEHLPAGADINDLTYDQFIQWGVNLREATGSNQIGLPAGDGGLLHRFIHGYIYPAYTGSVVTEFRSAAAVTMWEKFRELWDVVSPQSTTYSHMEEPLLSGEVMVAFDHTVRLDGAFKGPNGDDFIIFPAPRGPEGRWILPVPIGVAIPTTTPDLAASEVLIDHLTNSESQNTFFQELGWVPVISGSTGGATGVAATILEGVSAQAAVSDNGVFPQVSDGGAFSAVYRDAFRRIVLNDEDITTVLNEQRDVLNQLFASEGAGCWAPDTTPASGVCQAS